MWLDLVSPNLTNVRRVERARGELLNESSPIQLNLETAVELLFLGVIC